MTMHWMMPTMITVGVVTGTVLFGAGSCKGSAQQPLPNFSTRRDSLNTEWESVLNNDVMRAAHANRLDLFVAPFSINVGAMPNVYVRSGTSFRLRIYRLGWYGGDGASLVYDSNTASPLGLPARNANVLCGRDSSLPNVRQADLDYGLVECPWVQPVTPSLKGQTTGIYLARVTATIKSITYDNHALYYVRDDLATSRLVLASATTDQVYNLWTDSPDPTSPTQFAGRSLYSPWYRRSDPRASKVSFNRPQEDLSDFFKTTYPLIRFLEKEALAYKVATDFDVSGTNPNSLSIIVAGHNEYWSGATRNRLDNAVATGKNMLVLSANAGYWQIRYEASPAAMPSPSIVGYKENALITNRTDAACGAIIFPSSAVSCGDPVVVDGDPSNDWTATTLFRADPVGRPEQLLFGVQYQIEPAANTFEQPVTLSTNVLAAQQSTGGGIIGQGNITLGGSSCPSQGVIGYEADVVHPELWLRFAPGACLKVQGGAEWETTLVPSPDESGNYAAHLVLYRPSPSSGHVFGGFSMLWSWGLDSWASDHALGGSTCSRVQPMLQTLTRNMLNSAQSGSFGSDCSSPSSYSLSFSSPDPNNPGNEIILKEDDVPGRWAIVSIDQSMGDVRFTPNAMGTSDLSGWAVSSSLYDSFVADVNGDGQSDLIAKEKNPPGNWYVALSTTDSSAVPPRTRFVPQPQVWLSGWAITSSAYNLFAADVNGDHKADIIAKEKNSPGNWYVAISNGSQFLPQPTALSGWAVVSDAYDLFIGDVNIDGRADLIAKEKNSPGNWYVACSNGTTFIPQPTWLSGWAVVSDAYNLFAADVTGDGKVDLIAKEKGAPGNWYVAASNGSSFVPQPTWLSGWAVASSAYELYIADVSDDLRADLIAKERSTGHWYVAKSTGASFQAQGTLALQR